jgi:hypothetical protein
MCSPCRFLWCCLRQNKIFTTRQGCDNGASTLVHPLDTAVLRNWPPQIDVFRCAPENRRKQNQLPKGRVPLKIIQWTKSKERRLCQWRNVLNCGITPFPYVLRPFSACHLVRVTHSCESTNNHWIFLYMYVKLFCIKICVNLLGEMSQVLVTGQILITSTST